MGAGEGLNVGVIVGVGDGSKKGVGATSDVGVGCVVGVGSAVGVTSGTEVGSGVGVPVGASLVGVGVVISAVGSGGLKDELWGMGDAEMEKSTELLSVS